MVNYFSFQVRVDSIGKMTVDPARERAVNAYRGKVAEHREYEQRLKESECIS